MFYLGFVSLNCCGYNSYGRRVITNPHYFTPLKQLVGARLAHAGWVKKVPVKMLSGKLGSTVGG